MWPFSRKSRPQQTVDDLMEATPISGEAFLELQCMVGFTELVRGRGVVALVLDARQEVGASEAVAQNDDGSQLALIKVASDDGGFTTQALTPRAGPPLVPGEIVIWVPMLHDASVGAAMGDPRKGWVGLIRAKVAAELSSSDHFRVLHEY